MKKIKTVALALLSTGLTAGFAYSAAHAQLGVEAADQDVSGGTVTAHKIVAAKNGWLVVHRTGTDKKPGPVVGHAPLKAGENTDVTAILTEEVKAGEMLNGEKGPDR